ncbi:MAG: hypothetical protein MUF01_16710, partial [Bryobacterales bacterium]|nr:hypothetical protein [Bryobacterales bacterium]
TARVLKGPGHDALLRGHCRNRPTKAKAKRLRFEAKSWIPAAVAKSVQGWTKNQPIEKHVLFWGH